LSATKLKTGFKRVFNQSVHQYLMDFRTRQAIMLLESGMGIQDIANQLGYSSVSHFSRDFRKRTGQPPSLFQKVQV
ncbi:MAG TPA: AraC family transcriptional regulator, partial [Cytophagales bacterium]|nr:AraC family transcriptional regulator [Cytophagales bacterium]